MCKPVKDFRILFLPDIPFANVRTKKKKPEVSIIFVREVNKILVPTPKKKYFGCKYRADCISSFQKPFYVLERANQNVPKTLKAANKFIKIIRKFAVIFPIRFLLNCAKNLVLYQKS
jgi:hypothetical protein